MSFTLRRGHAGVRVRCSGIESGANRAAAVDAYYEPKTPFVICATRDQIMQVLDAIRAHKSAPIRPLGAPRRWWDANICAFGNQASF
jgi:hypothetical protein